MKTEYFFGKISELKERFATLFQNKKQLKAIENYSEVRVLPPVDKRNLRAIRLNMKESFLEEEDIDYLNAKLKRYQLEYLHWAHKTPWLQRKMKRMKDAQTRVEQTTFGFEAENEAIRPILKQNRVVL